MFYRIHAGGSGVGTAATQLATESGCRVFVTAGTEEKIVKCKELGAVGGANYKIEEWDEKIKELAQLWKEQHMGIKHLKNLHFSNYKYKYNNTRLIRNRW